MKKPTKIETLNRNLSLPKEDRKAPAVGIDAELAVDIAHINKCLEQDDALNIKKEELRTEVGKTLLKIQAEKRFSEPTFDAFVIKTWQRKRQWAYQQIDAYKIVAELPANVRHGVQNERQARELKKAPKEKRAAVLKEASKDGDPTAKKIKQVIEKTIITDVEHREIICDANGDEVPEGIASEFQRAERESKEHISFAQQIKNYLERDDITTIEARGLRETAKDLLAGLKTHLTKHVLCPKCAGKKCAVCSKRGFVSNHFATKGIGKK